MTKFLLKILVSSLAVAFSAYILPGVSIDKFTTAILVAIMLAILNSILKPILVFFTIPVTIITFGFFLLVINGFLILLTSYYIDGFQVDGFWWAFLFSIILSLTTSIMESLTRKHAEAEES